MTKLLKHTGLAALALLLATGCQIGQDMNKNWQQFNQIVDLVSSGGSHSSIARGTVEANPFASMGFRYGNSPQAFISLAQSQSGQLFWASRDGLTIVTEHGRIVQTVGFPDNLTGGKSTTKDPLSLPHSTEWSEYPFFRILDFKDDLGYGHHMECSLKDLGAEEITILGRTFTARKFAEPCRVPTLKWSFENTHWLDANTGFVWRTRQWISPGLKKPIELEVLRPAAEDPAWQIHSALTTAY